MRVGQITWVTFPNFGTYLQAYALQQVLKQLGHKSEIIDDKRYTWLDITPKHVWGWTKSMIRRPKKTWRKLTMVRPFREFADQHLNVRRKWSDANQLAADYDCFVCGSDQIWSPLLPEHFDGFYFAAFAHPTAKKIAYAPSLGSKTAPKEYRAMVKPWLESFAALSAREAPGAEIIAEISGRNDVQTVLDPTLLLTGQEWQELERAASLPQSLSQSKFMVVYLLTYNETYLKAARRFADRKGLKLAVFNLDMRMAPYADTVIPHSGPMEFLTALAHADYVMTDSFHATIFSIHFRRPFVTFKRFKDGEKRNQNSRLENLFGMLKISDNLIGEEQIADSAFALPLTPDWDAVESALEIERLKSINYLKSALDA